MEIVGTCNGRVMLDAEMPQVFDYLSDHEKIIGFNPFCKGVTPMELENVYRWDFEITDPTGRLVHLIFFVEQIETYPHHATHGALHQSIIKWLDYPVDIDGGLPNDCTYIGKAGGQMVLNQKGDGQTVVDVNIRIDVPFIVPPLLKVFPEKIVKKMAELAMTVAMQAVSKKMLENINNDFKYSVLEDRVTANTIGKVH
jgi:hypothetical protein